MKIKKLSVTQKIHTRLNDIANAFILALTAMASADLAGFSIAELFTSREKKAVVVAVGLFKMIAKLTEPKPQE